MNKNLIFVFSMILPSISMAFFCPTNFSQIEYKMTMDQVIQICGAPDEIKKSIKKDENIPQEWVYFVPQNVSQGNFQDGPTQGTLKTSITFNDQGNAINISVNGIGVGASQICGTRSIQLGNSKDVIKAACGQPVAITQLNNPNIPQKPEVTINEFYYKKSIPPVVLIFEDGILRAKK